MAIANHLLSQALARAIYAQKDIVILDDCLSGLDGHTENRVWHSLFGREGLLRRCRSTVLIASSSGTLKPSYNILSRLLTHFVSETLALLRPCCGFRQTR